MEYNELQKALRRKLQSMKKPSSDKTNDPAISEKTHTGEDKEITELERLLEKTKAKMREIRQQEMSRISKEFTENSYAKKFGISQREMIAVMVGEEDAKQEWEKQMKEREEYIRHKMGGSTFSFGGRICSQRASTSIKKCS